MVEPDGIEVSKVPPAGKYSFPVGWPPALVIFQAIPEKPNIPFISRTDDLILLVKYDE